MFEKEIQENDLKNGRFVIGEDISLDELKKFHDLDVKFRHGLDKDINEINISREERLYIKNCYVMYNMLKNLPIPQNTDKQGIMQILDTISYINNEKALTLLSYDNRVVNLEEWTPDKYTGLYYDYVVEYALLQAGYKIKTLNNFNNLEEFRLDTHASYELKKCEPINVSELKESANRIVNELNNHQEEEKSREQ